VDEAKNCPECHSDDLRIEGSRDRTAPRRKAQATNEEPVVVARTLWIRCEGCGHTWPITRAVKRET